MSEGSYRYIIVGAGLAGASAAEAIREHDADGTVLLIGAEADLPYHRPPLSKQLWFGKQKEGEVYVHDAAFYAAKRITLRLGVRATLLDPARKRITDSKGGIWHYDRLLLATGGEPRKLDIPGGDLDGICYYRTLADYHRLVAAASGAQSAVVIGGGFIGSEMAAALTTRDLAVTMLFPDRFLVSRVFPESLARSLTAQYTARGIAMLSGDVPTAIERQGSQYLTRTRAGRQLTSDLVVVGIGIAPGIQLAIAAGLQTGNGIIVNRYLQTSDPAIYAAGDNAFFPERIIGPTRVEHWNNAQSQGGCAGHNMAGAGEPYDYLPFFFSDLFEFGYEAVGQVDSRFQTFADWLEESKTGVIYYLQDSKLRGAMMCNVWEKVETARQLILQDRTVSPTDLRGAIR